MGWTGCGRARRRANVAPMCHYMPSKSSSDSSSSPSSSTVSSVGWMRVPATMLRGRCARTVRRATFFLKESLQVVPVKGSPAWYALSISDKQGCDCYSVGAVARDLEALAGADELGRVELAGDERAWRESLAQRHDHVHALAHVAHRLQLLLGSTISLPVGGVVLWLLPVKCQLVVLCGG